MADIFYEPGLEEGLSDTSMMGFFSLRTFSSEAGNSVLNLLLPRRDDSGVSSETDLTTRTPEEMERRMDGAQVKRAITGRKTSVEGENGSISTGRRTRQPSEGSGRTNSTRKEDETQDSRRTQRNGRTSMKKRKEYADEMARLEERNLNLEKRISDLEKHNRRLEEENRSLQDQSHQLGKTNQSYDERVRILEGEKRVMEERYRVLDEQNRSRSREVGGLSERNKALERQGREMEAQLRGLGERYHALDKHNHALEENSQRQIKEIESARVELHRMKAQNTQTTALLDIRTTELQGTQVFLTKADLLSGAEVTRMMDEMNAEILQAAAFMADSFDYGAGNAYTDDVAIDFQAGHYIGPDMVHLLRTTRHEEDPTLIQIAIQACLTLFSSFYLSSWIFDNTQGEKLLNDLYGKMRNEEVQAVSGRWRALTRAHIQPWLGNEVAILARLTSDIVAALSFILALAGCDTHRIHETIAARFNDRISTIVGMALRLNRAIGQDVTSGDLVPILVRAGEGFDPSTMLNAYDEGPSRSGRRATEIVMCTTDLGLRRGEKVVKGDGVEIEDIILLKPKVVLKSVTKSLSKGV